ncbi:hypothetical protein A9267_11985 [Shewanella sp. UCD-FRSSP16_17]|uniref:hypothetical protein n=1 Tax=Shewanella sp. UCD-FRSSP16_17 TaxID=1853256 RepID=UPI0007EE9A30|nr:hypothetical protein [Shewanella sp. UCD-FRSSP16_17]OBT08404.1 hypothetical protein A9267_11985 [Shewanella sp. UCD-FRSSP16_17]
MIKSKYQFRVYRYIKHPSRINRVKNPCHSVYPTTVNGAAQPNINHPLHFLLTLATLGLWAMVWWWLILKSRGKESNWLAGFDDDYWSYLIERECPPAALYPVKIGNKETTFIFEA